MNRYVSVEEAYEPEAVALLAANPRWDLGRLERECASRGIPCRRKQPFLRKLVPLAPGEEWREWEAAIPIPEGMRLETDDEFRARIKTELKAG